ncbi:MAG: metal-dependent hydrolase, partial [Actinomycetota bacterium]
MILWHAGLTMLIVWFVLRGNQRVDYRIVAIASLIPDLIDKPIGRIIFKSRFESGRIYAHTLILNLALFCILFFMRGRAKRKFVLIPLSSLLHLAEDGVWSTPQVFWWPLFGTSFPREPVSGGLFAFFGVFA